MGGEERKEGEGRKKYEKKKTMKGKMVSQPLSDAFRSPCRDIVVFKNI